MPGPASTPALNPGTCRYCGEPVVWGTLQNGRARSFEPDPVPGHIVPPAEAHAFSRRIGAVVCLDGVGWMPGHVLVPHYCDEFYAARVLRHAGRAFADIEARNGASTA